jgi:hypothetical protein
MASRWLAAVAAALLLGAAGTATAQPSHPDVPLDGRTDTSLEEVARQVHNPVGPLWQLTFDNEILGTDGGGLGDLEPCYTGSFEPTLPTPLSRLGLGRFEWAEKFQLVTGLTVPFVESFPVVGGGGADERRTGFGDIQLAALIAPNRRRGAFVAAGPNFIFPSASGDALGQGKWQAGPAVAVGHVSSSWTAYLLAQQWWSFAGDRSRPDTSQLNLEYVLVRNLPERWQVGMQPTLTVDWNASTENAVAFPVGLGFGRTIRLGGIPVQLWLEVDYYAVHPADQSGPRWGIDLQITPVVRTGF